MEDEHFEVSDSVISWIESYKTLTSCNITATSSNDKIVEFDFLEGSTSLLNIPPPQSILHQSSAPGMAWNLVTIFSKKQKAIKDLLTPNSAKPEETLSTSSSYTFQPIQSIKKSSLEQEVSSNLQSDIVDSFSSTHVSDHVIDNSEANINNIRLRGNDEWAPPRPQIIFNIHENTNFRKLMQRQNYRCSGCGTKIDLELARRLVLYCHYLGKYFCKCCFGHKAIHLPGYILQKWDFHKYPVSHFALQLLDRIANEPLFNINDINPSLYRKVKKLKLLIDIRMQLYYLKIYITTCPQTDKLNGEYTSFAHQHLLQDDVHLYSLNNLIEIQHGKLYEYLDDLVTRSIAHIAQCDRCRAKGHYCQLCGPSSLMSSMILHGSSQASGDNQTVKLKHSDSIGQNISAATDQPVSSTSSDAHLRQGGQHSRSSSGNYSSFNSGSSFNAPPAAVVAATAAAISNQPISVVNVNDHELIFPFEIGRVAQCRVCGCCFHLQCFLEAGQNCPKCERIQRRKAETEPLSEKLTPV